MRPCFEYATLPPMLLTGKQKRHLRALGHHLEPVVQIGKNGITEALVAQIGEAITRHELLKVKLLPECPIERDVAGDEVAKAVGAELAQTLGRTLLLWKRNPQAAKVDLPRASGPKKGKAKAAGEESAEEPKAAAKKKAAPKRQYELNRPVSKKRPTPKRTFGERTAQREVHERPTQASSKGKRPPSRSPRPAREESQGPAAGNAERPVRSARPEAPGRHDSPRPRARRPPPRSG